MKIYTDPNPPKDWIVRIPWKFLDRDQVDEMDYLGMEEPPPLKGRTKMDAGYIYCPYIPEGKTFKIRQ